MKLVALYKTYEASVFLILINHLGFTEKEHLLLYNALKLPLTPANARSRRNFKWITVLQKSAVSEFLDNSLEDGIMIFNATIDLEPIRKVEFY